MHIFLPLNDLSKTDMPRRVRGIIKIYPRMQYVKLILWYFKLSIHDMSVLVIFISNFTFSYFSLKCIATHTPCAFVQNYFYRWWVSATQCISTARDLHQLLVLHSSTIHCSHLFTFLALFLSLHLLSLFLCSTLMTLLLFCTVLRPCVQNLAIQFDQNPLQVHFKSHHHFLVAFG